MKVTNKELLQSYVVTAAKYDFSVYEKRILYRIIEVMQAQTKGLKLSYDYSIQPDLFNKREFTLPVACFLNGEEDKNYSRVKKALYSLRQKAIEYEDDEKWGVYGIIESPEIHKYNSHVKFTITPLLWGAFLNFSKGFRKYELKVAMRFESVYAMRFYELLSGKSAPIIYKIDELRQMFMLETKYKETKDFIKRVIEPAKKEMNSKAPTGFQYEIQKTGRKYTHIKFKPFANPKFKDQDIERKELMKQIPTYMILDKETVAVLKEKFKFDENGIKHNIDTLKQGMGSLGDFRAFCSNVQGMIRQYGISNPAGFFISELKKELGE